LSKINSADREYISAGVDNSQVQLTAARPFSLNEQEGSVHAGEYFQQFLIFNEHQFSTIKGLS